MRDRKTIEKALKKSSKHTSFEDESIELGKLQVELLLDIREGLESDRKVECVGEDSTQETGPTNEEPRVTLADEFNFTTTDQVTWRCRPINNDSAWNPWIELTDNADVNVPIKMTPQQAGDLGRYLLAYAKSKGIP